MQQHAMRAEIKNSGSTFLVGFPRYILIKASSIVAWRPGLSSFIEGTYCHAMSPGFKTVDGGNEIGYLHHQMSIDLYEGSISSVSSGDLLSDRTCPKPFSKDALPHIDPHQEPHISVPQRQDHSVLWV